MIEERLEKSEKIMNRFREIYARESRLFRAPGRVNLIGEHTDYNEGFVMPSAIDRYAWAAAAPLDERRLVVRSEDFSEEMEFPLDDPAPQTLGHWSDYVRGVAIALEESGHRLRGACLLIQSDVPIGSGLSSSAAIEVASGLALTTISGFSIDPIEMAKLCQRAENQFVGTQCGIMDQFISCCGRSDQALLLDCRSLEYEMLPLSQNAKLVICNTMVKHRLAGGEYNERRAQCEAALRYFARSLPGIRALRDVTPDDLERAGTELPEIIYRRARHVISENARVIRASLALKGNDFDAFGQLMNQSHVSLRDDYEVSCPELDLMVELASQVEGVYGARMTGGGFGGCTINLVESESVERFKQIISTLYNQATNILPEIYVCAAAEGASAVDSRQ